jgi:thiol-disulfide isomerase/thioredoxin
MKNTFIILIFFASLSAIAQDVIVGKTSVDTLKETPYNSWYTDGYKTFTPKSEVIEELKDYINNGSFNVEVYFGTWCSDSQREVPRLVKIFDKAKFDFNNLKLIGVDRDKVVPGISKEEREKLNITNVPTIIVYQNGREINRFVEFAQETLEEDLLKIFSKKPYKHSYQF